MVSIPVDDKLAQKIEALAKKMNRPVEDVAGDAFRKYLDYTERFIADVEAGIKDADEGRVHTIEEAEAELARRRAARAR